MYLCHMDIYLIFLIFVIVISFPVTVFMGNFLDSYFPSFYNATFSKKQSAKQKRSVRI